MSTTRILIVDDELVVRDSLARWFESEDFEVVTAPSATEALDPQAQRMSALTQAGWRIDYTEYRAVGADAVPARLTLQRDTVRVRLLVDDWQLQ